MLRVGAADKVLANRVLPGKVGYPASGELVTVSQKVIV
jgi:hypothetical protein